MSIFSNGTFTPPGKIIISNSRANPTERISHLHNHAIPIHFHHHKSKNCFHNVYTVACVLNAELKKEGAITTKQLDLFTADLLSLTISTLSTIAENSNDKNNTQLAKDAVAVIKEHSEAIVQQIAEAISDGIITPEATRTFYMKLINKFNENPNISENTRELIKKLVEANASHEAHPAISATAHKAKALMLERSNVGRKLSDKNALSTLYEANGIVHTGQKGKKEITAVVSLSFSELEEWKSHVPAFKRLKPFDMDILAHAVTLYQAGNQVISTDMLFRQMNGGKHKETTQAMRNEIYDSFARLAQTWISINAQEEFNAGYNTQPVFKGALMPCSMIIGGNITINGQPAHDCIKLYDKSPLIEYAKAKGQISNIPLAMFDIPKVNRTTDNIALIGYLIRAYADMTHPHSKIKPIISYQPIYDYLGVEGSNPTQLRKNKARIRATVKQILTAWRDMGFIKGFYELTEDNKPVRPGAKVSKVKIEFFTDKKLKSGHDSENNSANK